MSKQHYYCVQLLVGQGMRSISRENKIGTSESTKGQKCDDKDQVNDDDGNICESDL